MTQEPPEADPLAALGHVDPPPPAVLDAAREILWSAVAQEMLARNPDSSQSAPSAASGQSAASGRPASGQSDPAADRRAERPPDPGA